MPSSAPAISFAQFIDYCKTNNVEAVRRALVSPELGFSLGDWDKNGNTPLKYAMRHEDLTLAYLLAKDPLCPRESGMLTSSLYIMLTTSHYHIAQIFAQVVFASDGYTAVTTRTTEDDAQHRAKRFFAMVTRLPIELQMLICNCVGDKMGEMVLSADLEAALKREVKAILSREEASAMPRGQPSGTHLEGKETGLSLGN